VGSDMAGFRSLRSLGRQGPDPDAAALKVRSCRDLCNWIRTPVERRGEPLFACRGCGSQWVPSEPWTPRESTGVVPPEILEIVRSGE